MIIRLEAVSRRPFNDAVADSLDAITACGGWVKTHQLYANMMAMIAFELPAGRVEALARALAAAAIAVTPPARWPAGDGDVVVQLTISFAGGGPDVRRPVPAFG